MAPDSMAVGYGQLHHGDIEPMTAPRLTFQDGKLVIKDGKAATGQECCCKLACECVRTSSALSGKTLTCSVTGEFFAGGPGDCPADTVTADGLTLTWSGANEYFEACDSGQLSNGTTYILRVVLACLDGVWTTWAALDTGIDCDQNLSGFCTLGNGAFVGQISADNVALTQSQQGELCVPDNFEGSYANEYGSVEWSLTIT